MAIDPKELRVGAHVDCRGFRREVCGILGDRIALIVKRHPLKGCETASFASDFISPILITPELLTEMGFEKHEIHGKAVYRKIYKEIPKLGTMFYALCYNPIAEAWDFQAHPTLSECKYLHELESMVYLATKQELIND